MYIYTYTSRFIKIYACAYTNKCICKNTVLVCLYIYVHVHKHVLIYACTLTCANMHMGMYTYAPVFTYACMHAYM